MFDDVFRVLLAASLLLSGLSALLAAIIALAMFLAKFVRLGNPSNERKKVERVGNVRRDLIV